MATTSRWPRTPEPVPPDVIRREFNASEYYTRVTRGEMDSELIRDSRSDPRTSGQPPAHVRSSTYTRLVASRWRSCISIRDRTERSADRGCPTPKSWCSRMAQRCAPALQISECPDGAQVALFVAKNHPAKHIIALKRGASLQYLVANPRSLLRPSNRFSTRWWRL